MDRTDKDDVGFAFLILEFTEEALFIAIKLFVVDEGTNAFTFTTDRTDRANNTLDWYFIFAAT